MPREGYVSLEGSHREPLPGARAIAPADPDEQVDVTVVVRRKTAMNGAAAAPEGRMSRRELAQAHGADPADLDAVAAFAREHDLQVLSRDEAGRRMVLSGTVGALQQAFDVQLARFEHEGGGTYRGRTGTVAIPESLKDVVVAVLGLDDRPQAHAHSRIVEEIDEPGAETAAPRANGSFTPPDLAKLYDFPTGVDGSGQCIGIIELGGGFRQRDITAYFSSLGLTPPTVVAVSVDHGRNHPSFPQSADGEVMLDIEAAGAVAPGARIAVYFAPNTDRGFADAISHAVQDDQNQPSIISISWGGPEKNWTQQSIDTMEAAFEDAASLGVTVFCAAGDSGSSDGVNDGKAHVDYPASSPNVVGCGGTHLTASSGHIGTETVWQTNGATGGGVSDVFTDVPQWQKDAGVKPKSANPPHAAGRGVPDVAADADPATGYVIRVDGRTFVIGGTSAVAPLWSGLTALINQELGGAIGFVNPALYEIGESAGAFGDITQGSNGAYNAGTGWDPCTGWGSPRGAELLDALRSKVSATPVKAT